LGKESASGELGLAISEPFLRRTLSERIAMGSPMPSMLANLAVPIVHGFPPQLTIQEQD
jgi:hypothetical protein